MEHKKVQTEFTFEEYYYSQGGSRQTASVILKVNYSAKTFNIEPSTGADNFKFKNNSHEWKMWVAVSNCIAGAIDFATKELGFVAKDPIKA
jgi:hypothetical protein